MIKQCYVLNQEIINIGEWDYLKEQVEVSPAEYDEEGNIVKDAVFEEVINNPLPEAAMEQERDFDYSEERGWFEVGTIPNPSEKERIQELENMILFLMMNGGM